MAELTYDHLANFKYFGTIGCIMFLSKITLEYFLAYDMFLTVVVTYQVN